MRGLPATTLLLAVTSAASCGKSQTVYVQGEAPPGAASVLLALEQDEAQHVELREARQEVLALAFPDSMDEERPTSLTFAALALPMEALGATKAGPISPAPEPAVALGELPPLEVRVASLVGGLDRAVLAPGPLSPWLGAFTLPRQISCPTIEHELVLPELGIRDAVSVSADLAVGLSNAALTTFRAGQPPIQVPLEGGEVGRGIGLSREGRVWVSTSSRAAVFDPDTGQFTRSVSIGDDRRFLGLFDDEANGHLYLVSSEAEIWEYEHANGVLRLGFTVPDHLVRRPQIEKVQARIVPLPEPGRFIMAMEEIAAVLDYDGASTHLFTGERPGNGFPAIVRLEDRRIMVVESVFGDIYLFDGMTWTAAGQTTSRIYGLSPLDEGRWLFVTVRAIAGVLDLAAPGSCPERPLSGWNDARSLVRVGDDFYVATTDSRVQAGWGRLTVTLD